MINLTIFFDLHGVLANTELLQGQYIKIIEKIYSDLGKNKREIKNIQKQILHKLSIELDRLHTSTLKDVEFTNAIFRYKNEMNRLYKAFLSKSQLQHRKAKLLTSTNFDYLTSASINSFYPDAQQEFNNFLVDSDFKVYIASNSSSDHIMGALEAAGLLKKFKRDQILGWEIIQCAKSTQDYYTRLKNYAIDSSHAIMVGNSSDEVLHAKKAGFQTVTIQRHESLNFPFVEDTISTKAQQETNIYLNSLNGLYSFLKTQLPMGIQLSH